MNVRSADSCPHAKSIDEGCTRQIPDENLETRTASAISTPHRHFSHIICCHPAVQPFGSSGFPLGPPRPGGVGFGRAIAELPKSGDAPLTGCSSGCGDEADFDAGGSGIADFPTSFFPISFSAMLGKFRILGVQYSGKASLNLFWVRFHA